MPAAEFYCFRNTPLCSLPFPKLVPVAKSAFQSLCPPRVPKRLDHHHCHCLVHIHTYILVALHWALPSGSNVAPLNGCPYSCADDRPEAGRLTHLLRCFLSSSFATIPSAWAEDRALLRSNSSAVPGAGTEAGSAKDPVFPFPNFRTGTNAVNLGGLGAKPPEEPTSRSPRFHHNGRPFL